jgi:tetratricopeptide (TPR) repeat protein
MPDSKLTDRAKPTTGGQPAAPEASEQAAEHERALESARNAFGASSIEAAAVLVRLGRVHCRAGRFAEAHTAYVGALEIAEEKLGPDHVRLASIYYGLAELELARGRFATGEPYARRSLEICERAAAAPGEIADSIQILDALLAEQGRPAESESGFRRDKP